MRKLLSILGNTLGCVLMGAVFIGIIALFFWINDTIHIPIAWLLLSLALGIIIGANNWDGCALATGIGLIGGFIAFLFGDYAWWHIFLIAIATAISFEVGWYVGFQIWTHILYRRIGRKYNTDDEN